MTSLLEYIDAQLGKTPQKLDLKNREINWSYLCLQQFDKYMQWPETETVNLQKNFFKKLREITSNEQNTEFYLRKIFF